MGDKHYIKEIKEYCTEFSKGRGKDLFTIVHYKANSENYPIKFKYNLSRNHKARWGFLLAVNGTSDNSGTNRYKNDVSKDHSKNSVFPIVNVKEVDLLLLSMAFDDTVEERYFLLHVGTDFVNVANGRDDAGCVYSKKTTHNGAAGKSKTSSYQ